MRVEIAERPFAVLISELRKTAAFARRDLLVSWSYRVAFISDWTNLFLQIALFYFVGKLVDPEVLSSASGTASYVEFVAIGIAVGSFLQIGMSRVVTTIRNEQTMGTLESLLVTPTAPTTIQLGSVMYDLLYVPIRTMLFLTMTAAVLGAHFDLDGAVPAAVILLAFVPFVWGLGMISAAGIVVFRRGVGIVGLLAVALTATSNMYVPVDVFPGWLRSLAEHNPITVAVDAERQVLLNDALWAPVLPALAILVPVALLSIALGVGAFRVALRRERRRGTLGVY